MHKNWHLFDLATTGPRKCTVFLSVRWLSFYAKKRQKYVIFFLHFSYITFSPIRFSAHSMEHELGANFCIYMFLWKNNLQNTMKELQICSATGSNYIYAISHWKEMHVLALYSDRICYFIWVLKRTICIVLSIGGIENESRFFFITWTNIFIFSSFILFKQQSIVSIFKRNMFIQSKGFLCTNITKNEFIFVFTFFPFHIFDSFLFLNFPYFVSTLVAFEDDVIALKVVCLHILFLGHIWYWDQHSYFVQVHITMAWLK